MEKEEKKKWKHWKHAHKWHESGGGHFYGMGFLGALFYFLQHVTTFQDGIIGIGKAIVWPALVVFKVLELLKF